MSRLRRVDIEFTDGSYPAEYHGVEDVTVSDGWLTIEIKSDFYLYPSNVIKSVVVQLDDE